MDATTVVDEVVGIVVEGVEGGDENRVDEGSGGSVWVVGSKSGVREQIGVLNPINACIGFISQQNRSEYFQYHFSMSNAHNF